MVRIPFAVAFLAVTAGAQPFIFSRGVVNAASFAPPGLPNAGLARGSIFTVFGRNLGPATGEQVSAFPVAAVLAGVRVEVCQNNACLDALPIYVRQDQVNAILPSNTPLGRNAIRVTFQGTTGNNSPVTVVEAATGIFSATGIGAGPGIVQNFESATSLPLNSTAAAAKPGQAIVIWLTGLGPGLNPDNQAPQAGDLPTPVEVFIGGKLASKLYSGRSPCCSGLDQIVVTIPSDSHLGCYVPVQVRTSGGVVSNSTTIAISADGSQCSDAHNPFVPAFFHGGKIGTFLGERFTLNADVDPLAPVDQVSEWGRLFLRELRANPFQFHPLLSLSPVGTCTTYSVRGNAMQTTDFPLDSLSTVKGLDAGTATVHSGTASAGLVRTTRGVQEERIGDNFDSGTLIYGSNDEASIATSGGPDVGAIQATVMAPPYLTWTNRSEVRILRKSQPLTLRWSEASGVVYISGVSVDPAANASGVFRCVADPASGSFTVPPWALANLPVSRNTLGSMDALVSIGVGPATHSGDIRAAGLDFGASVFRSWTGNSVRVEE